jgi:hypothetical protein
LLPLPSPILLLATLVAITIAQVAAVTIAIAFVAVTCPPPSSPSLLPPPSSLHATLVANAIALFVAIAHFIACHPYCRCHRVLHSEITYHCPWLWGAFNLLVFLTWLLYVTLGFKTCLVPQLFGWIYYRRH